jgi:L-ascorbate metabolism protein UlaG (beta-lactamase superfamily)
VAKYFIKMIRKGFKIFGITIAMLILVVLVTGTLFMNISPQFGALPSKEQQNRYATSKHYNDGVFVNETPTTLDIGFVNTVRILYDFLFKDKPGLEPESPIPVQKIDSLEIVQKRPALKRLTWFGHSACLLEMDGKLIFFDPMLGDSPAPLPLLGPQRFNKELPISIEKLPYIDAVVLSHDHYDHLDYGSIMKLKDKVGRFYVPLGVSAHLAKWGVDADKITELDWWQESTEDGFTFICTPARHFSGRGLFDRFTTLWASWIVKTENSNVYFSGDSGFGPHFKEIGTRYGPFDFVMLECGQYNTLWMDIHMMPERTVQAAIDLKGKLMMPIHWGAFTLAMHTWIDPIDRVTVEAHERLMPITTPQIGEPVLLQQPVFPRTEWWK